MTTQPDTASWMCPCPDGPHLPPIVSPVLLSAMVDVRVALAAVPHPDSVAAHRRWAYVVRLLTEQGKACWAEAYKPVFMGYPTEIVPARG